MPDVRLVLVSAEEAYDGNAEFWCGGELMAITVLVDGRLQLRVDPRPDGEPWVIETQSLARALQHATERIAVY
jgi:hypothetical protein